MTISRKSAMQKGSSGEWEIIGILSNILVVIYREHQYPIPENGLLQRGPNGKDIVGLSWLAPEVKRHELAEACHINTWWEQAKSQAKRNAAPVLFWRTNKRAWNVRMFGRIALQNGGAVRCPVDITISDFLVWFTHEARARLAPGIHGPIKITPFT